jgi:RimJ/RimL family protein N-acetyltransferase
MWVKPVTLEGERVRLEPLDESHVEGLAAAGDFPEIWAYYPFASGGLDGYAGFALREKAKNPAAQLCFVVIDKETGSICGATGFLDIQPANRSLEIGGTWYTPSVWRTRVNSECKYLLMTHAFEELGAIRVSLKTDSRNRRSQAAIERLGAKREGVLRNHVLYPDGYRRASVYFSVIEEEWPEVKARLERFLAR